MLTQDELKAKGLQATLLTHPLVQHKLSLMRDNFHFKSR